MIIQFMEQDYDDVSLYHTEIPSNVYKDYIKYLEKQGVVICSVSQDHAVLNGRKVDCIKYIKRYIQPVNVDRKYYERRWERERKAMEEQKAYLTVEYSGTVCWPSEDKDSHVDYMMKIASQQIKENSKVFRLISAIERALT